MGYVSSGFPFVPFGGLWNGVCGALKPTQTNHGLLPWALMNADASLTWSVVV